MRDYNYTPGDGTLIPIAQMRTEDIVQLLADGITIVADDGERDPASAVARRLRLELDIRTLGLR